MKVPPLGGQICNQCKLRHLVARFATNSRSEIDVKLFYEWSNFLAERLTQYHGSVVSLAKMMILSEDKSKQIVHCHEFRLCEHMSKVCQEGWTASEGGNEGDSIKFNKMLMCERCLGGVSTAVGPLLLLFYQPSANLELQLLHLYQSWGQWRK